MHIAAGVQNNALYLFTRYSLVIRMKANVTSPEAELLVFRQLRLSRNSKSASTLHVHEKNIAPEEDDERNTVKEGFAHFLPRRFL